MGDDPSPARGVPLLWPHEGLTIADVDALPDRDGVRYELVDGVRYELVDGTLFALTAPTIAHQAAVLEVHLALRATAPAPLRIVQGIGVALADDQRAVPDLVVARTPDRATTTVPVDDVTLVVEVVAPSTRSTDRYLKPGVFAQAGIPHYLRVELDPPHVVAYRFGADGVYEEAGRAGLGEILTLTDPFPITIDPAALVR